MRMPIFRLLCMFFFSCGSLFADAVVLNLSGHLTEEGIAAAQKQLAADDYDSVVLYIDSWSGNLPAALGLAEQLRAIKLGKGIKITVYTENRAIGPSSIFPFLADEWDATSVLTWGNVYYGSKVEIPPAEVTARIRKLIDSENPQGEILNLIAQAICDSNVQLVDQSGWKLVPLSPPAEPLVLNHVQLNELGFTIISMSSEQFHARYRLSLPGGQGGELGSAEIQERLSKAIHYSENDANYIGYIGLDYDEKITDKTFLQVKMAIEEFKKKGVIFILLHLNTPGGELFPALRITEVLQRTDTEDHIPIVATIHNLALSVGAMIPYSCRFVAVTDKSLMGAAETDLMNPFGTFDATSVEMTTALRKEFALLAEFFGRNPLLAEAMVDKKLLLVKRGDEIVSLTNEKEIQPQDLVLVLEGKLLTLTGQQLIDLNVADFYLPSAAIPLVTPQQQEFGRWPFTQATLYYYPFFSKIPSGVVLSYSSWKVPFFTFLWNGAVSSLLLIGFAIAIYFAMSDLGARLATGIALICLLAVLATSFAFGTDDWMKLLFLSLGVMFLILKLWIVPTSKMLGVFGIFISLLAMTFLLLPKLHFVHFGWSYEEWNLTAFYFFGRLKYLIGAQVFALLFIGFLARYLRPRLLERRALKLRRAGDSLSAELHPYPVPPVGTEGIAFTSLKPYGKILINGRLFDAIAEGEPIEKDQKIAISKISGGTISVKTDSRI